MNAIDTNILVYAFDTAYQKKRETCKELIKSIFDGKEEAVITNQILAEFAAVITKKIQKPLSRKDAETIIGAILSCKNFQVINYSGKTVLSAIQSKKQFWDALIIATLKENNITGIITENEKDFTGEGMTVRNPFKEMKKNEENIR
ncbi:MAG: PIN domain-containing protein [Nanoarchaeota archaeon]